MSFVRRSFVALTGLFLLQLTLLGSGTLCAVQRGANDNVSAALVGASRPEQVHENVKASGVKIPAEVLRQIDEVLGDVVVRDAAMTAKNSPQRRPGS